jgi:VWFA-related protein
VPAILLLLAGLRIVTPQSDQPVRGPRVIRVDPGNLQVEKVDFLVDQALIGSDDKPPFALLYDFGPGGRPHEIKVVAHLRRGASLEREIHPPPAPVPAARARAVVVDVAVYDRRGQLVDDLNPSDFAVFEDGEAQQVDFFALGSDDPRPLSVLLAIDTSESMGEQLELTSRAAREFIQALEPRDRIGLLTFNREVRLVGGLESTREEVLSALDRLEAYGDTALLRALEEGSLLLRELPGRRVGLSFDQVRRELLEAEVTVFPIGVQRWPDSGEVFLGRRQLVRLARETGGREQFLSRRAQIGAALDQVSLGLASRYMLSYRPPEGSAASWPELSINVARPELKVIAKPGYFERSAR